LPVGQVSYNDCRGIIDEMGKYGDPYRTAPIEQVTEKHAKHHPGKDSIKLQMHCAKQKGSNKNGNMNVFDPLIKKPLK